LEKYANKTGKKHIVTTAIEHKAVLLPINHLESKGFEVSYIQPDVNGRIDAQKLLSEVRNDTLLVSAMHSNNETGVIQPVDEIGEELSKKDILFHIYAAQSCGKLVEELQNIKYNMLSASAHKMYGPQGVGLLVLRKKCYKSPPVSSIMFGGSQEHGLRPGTIPTALIAGFGKAAELALKEYKFKTQSYLKTKNEILQLLESSGVAYKINGDISHSMPNTLNVSFKGVNSEALMLATKQYCSVSNGSACN
jgi:cysteine desulfurase